MDSCLIANECIDEMAAIYGKGDEVSAITRQYAESMLFLSNHANRAMHEGTPFDEALRKRVALLKGMTKEQVDLVWARLELNTVSEFLFVDLPVHVMLTFLNEGRSSSRACAPTGRGAHGCGLGWLHHLCLSSGEASRL